MAGRVAYLLFARTASRYRPLAIAFLAVAVIVILNRTSRSEYLWPAYPMLFAAGGAALERSVVARVWRLAIIGVVLVTGAISAPLALPLLSVDRYVGYSRALGIAPSTEERKELGRLPQFSQMARVGSVRRSDCCGVRQALARGARVGGGVRR